MEATWGAHLARLGISSYGQLLRPPAFPVAAINQRRSPVATEPSEETSPPRATPTRRTFFPRRNIPHSNRALIYKRPNPHRVKTSEGGFMFARLILASVLAVGLASAQGGQKGGGDMGGMGGDANGGNGGGMPRAPRQT